MIYRPIAHWKRFSWQWLTTCQEQEYTLLMVQLQRQSKANTSPDRGRRKKKNRAAADTKEAWGVEIFIHKKVASQLKGEYLVFCIWLQLKAWNRAEKRNKLAMFESSRSKINISVLFHKILPHKLTQYSWTHFARTAAWIRFGAHESKSMHSTHLLSFDSSIRSSHALNYLIHLEEYNWLEANNGIFNYANCFIL